MKKYLLLPVFIVVFCTVLPAQTSLTKLGTEIKKLSGEWQNGFSNIKGAIRSGSDAEDIYYSRMKVSGSVDSTNLIHYIKDRDTWYFTVDFEKVNMTAAMLDSVIKAIPFSFGEVKKTPTNTAWGMGYVPGNKKGASEKLRCFYLLVFDYGMDPQDKTGGMLSLTVGNDDYFRGK